MINQIYVIHQKNVLYLSYYCPPGINVNIYFIEGECKKNINKGLEQLTKFGECIKFICDVVEFKPEKIYTGVVSDLYSFTNNDNYFGYFLNKEQNQIKNGIFC